MKTIRIPAKRAVSFDLAAGTEFAVVNPAGTQVADLAAVSSDGIAFSQAHTRDLAGKTRVTTGDSLYAQDGSPLLAIVDDDCGVHDLLFAPCTGWLLEPPAFEPEPSGCREHLAAAFDAGETAAPDVLETVNLFQRATVTDHEHLEVRPSPASPGDEVHLRAEADAVVAVSSCAALNARSGINGETRTPVDVRIPDAATVRGPFPERTKNEGEVT